MLANVYSTYGQLKCMCPDLRPDYVAKKLREPRRAGRRDVPTVTKGASLWRTTVETREEALSIIKQVAIAFYCINAAVAVAAFVFKQPEALLASFLCASCAVFLQWKQSRFAAMLLLLWSAGQIGMVLASRFGLLGDVRVNLWIL